MSLSLTRSKLCFIHVQLPSNCFRQLVHICSTLLFSFSYLLAYCTCTRVYMKSHLLANIVLKKNYQAIINFHLVIKYIICFCYQKTIKNLFLHFSFMLNDPDFPQNQQPFFLGHQTFSFFYGTMTQDFRPLIIRL